MIRQKGICTMERQSRQCGFGNRFQTMICGLIYALGLTAYIPQSPPGTYLTLNLQELDFSKFTTNLLTIPNSVFGIITLLGITRLSKAVRERTFIAMIQPLWTLPCIITLRVWKGALVKPWPTYALMTALLSYPYCHAILVGWTSTNSNSVRTRFISAAVYNMCIQLGNIISANIYHTANKPLCHKGSTHLIIINVLAIFLFLFTKAYYVTRNSLRDKK